MNDGALLGNLHWQRKCNDEWPRHADSPRTHLKIGGIERHNEDTHHTQLTYIHTYVPYGCVTGGLLDQPIIQLINRTAVAHLYGTYTCTHMAYRKIWACLTT